MIFPVKCAKYPKTIVLPVLLDLTEINLYPVNVSQDTMIIIVLLKTV